MEKKQKKSKRPTGVLIGGILVVALAGAVAAAVYFKLLPGDAAQLAAEWSQKIPFVSRSDNTNSVNAPTDGQTQAVDQASPAENAATKPADAQTATTQNSTPAVPAVTFSGGNAKPDNKQDQSTKNIKKLSQVYAGMKPEEAATILNNLDIKTVSDILQKMEEDQAGKILAVMEAKRAAAISQELLQYRLATNPKTN